MLENFITQARRPKGVSSEREAQASAAACYLLLLVFTLIFLFAILTRCVAAQNIPHWNIPEGPSVLVLS